MMFPLPHKIAVCSLAVSFALSAGVVQAQAWEQGKTYNLTILHTNDHHGHFWKNEQGEYGLAAQKTLVEQIRKEVEAAGGSILLLSGGDVNTGVPESDLQHAEPDFRGMSMIGYDAMALGNHEFDRPLSVLRKQEQWATFPLLSANIYDEKSGERLFKPYALFDKQGIKIAVIGLTTEDTQKIGNPEYLKGTLFKDPKIEAKNVIAQLKKNEKPDVIIAATHMGHYQNAQHGSNAPGDVELARSLSAGDLDMIVGGHSQNPVCMEAANDRNDSYIPGTECKPDQQNGTWIVQAHEWGKYVGRADYQFKNGELQLVSYNLIPVNLKQKVKRNDGKSEYVLYSTPIAEDSDMLALLTPFQEKGQAELGIKIGEVDQQLDGDRSVVRFKQTNLGQLIAKSHMERVNADFGVMNSGGVRDSIEPGDISYKDVLKVQPFGNIVSYVDMKGRDIIDYLNVVATKKVDSGAYAQFANISMVVENGKVHDVKIAGTPIDMNKSYRFTVPSFNAAGGDGYPNIAGNAGYVNTGFVDAEVLKDYIAKKSPLKASQFAPNSDVIYK